MMPFRLSSVTRRTWLAVHVAPLTALSLSGRRSRALLAVVSDPRTSAILGRIHRHAETIDPSPVEQLLKQGVDAARSAGAAYADARFTRTIAHQWKLTGNLDRCIFSETVGFGIRALVNGYWGFAASPRWTPDEAGRLARMAVAQAKANATGPQRSVTLAAVPTVTGHWATPIRIDPFLDVSVEEKLDFIDYWMECAGRAQVGINPDSSYLNFTRQERVLATSDGTATTQTVYETGGRIDCSLGSRLGGAAFSLDGLEASGQGWELLLDANIPAQFAPQREAALQRARTPVKAASIGRYTLVCDGATMASLLDQTLGVATQLDRALGYEANAGGTSFIDDPLAMVGTLHIATPSVTVTANRSTPTDLATVKWDDEGVAPSEATLVKDGVLADFQTTREQASWLAPYYQRQHRSVQSNGYAAAASAQDLTIQQVPNLMLAPGKTAAGMTDLLSNVVDGILIERGIVDQMDAQARNGLLLGSFREIKYGRLGPYLAGGGVWFNTRDLWKKIALVGGPSTVGKVAAPASDSGYQKGEPNQPVASHTIHAAAALIPDQPVINPARKA